MLTPVGGTVGPRVIAEHLLAAALTGNGEPWGRGPANAARLAVDRGVR
ncbi:hypothetical protein [Streptomyces sp. Ru71]|nr:hypothetical protein [Streptomyces sp. Ru71]